MDFNMEDTWARAIFRALRKLGFEGFALKKEYLYFCSLPPFAADILLTKMLQAKGVRKRAN